MSTVTDPRAAHPGYAEQLVVETVGEWGDGYIDYGALMTALDEVVSARGNEAKHAEKIAAFIKLATAEIEKSGAFFTRELHAVQHRVRELGGAVSSPVSVKTSTEDAVTFFPDRSYMRSSNLDAAGCSGAEGSPTRASARSGGRRSTFGTRASAFSGDGAARRASAAAPSRELAAVCEKLMRFVEVQEKSVRHALDAAVLVCPPATDFTAIRDAFSGSAHLQLFEALQETRRDAADLARAHRRREGVQGSDAAAAGASAAEAYDWVIKWPYVLLAAVVLAVVYSVPILENDREAHACAAIILCVATLWVTEAMPFFATALLIPLLAVPFRALPGKNQRHTGLTLLSAMFDHTQTLVLGGLCLGKAVAKHKLERQIARFLLRPVASRPWLYLLVVMIASALLCAVISNVAAPVLIMSIVQPSLWELDAATGAPQAILLAVAFACNFGGMLTPIASPQNVVAQQALGEDGISFPEWVAAALPIVTMGILSSWAVVVLLWRPFRDVAFIPIPLATSSSDGAPSARLQAVVASANPRMVVTNDDGPGGDKSGYGSLEDDLDDAAAVAQPRTSTTTAAGERATPLLQAARDDCCGNRVSRLRRLFLGRMSEERAEVIIIVFVLAVTVLLWCVPEDKLLGDTGVVGLIPIVVFFGVGILKKADFNSLSWHLIFLLSGGNMLGVMSRESRLLSIVIDGLRPFLEEHGTFEVVAVLVASVALVTTFVSHTVAALLMMPVIVQVAAVNAELPSSRVLVFLSVIMCSGSMAFPITSFPNVNSLLTESSAGTPYLTARNFLVPGLAVSTLVLAQLMTYMVPYGVALFPRA